MPSRDTEIVTRTESTNDYALRPMGEYIVDCCLNRTFGEMVRARDEAANARTVLVARTVTAAVLEPDIALVNELVKRIDGLVPSEDERESFANIFGDALMDVLDYTPEDQVRVTADDPVVIALAKATFFIANQDVAAMPRGQQSQARRDRAAAVRMIFERTAGRKTEPEKQVEAVEYVLPEWMADQDETSD